MVYHSSRCRHSDRCDHAPGTAQAVVPEQADTHPGSHRLAERGSAGRVHLSPLSGSAGSAIGDSWLPDLAPAGVGRDLPGHLFRSERRRVDRLPGSALIRLANDAARLALRAQARRKEKVMKMAKPLQFLLLAVGVIA